VDKLRLTASESALKPSPKGWGIVPPFSARSPLVDLESYIIILRNGKSSIFREAGDNTFKMELSCLQVPPFGADASDEGLFFPGIT
jgi:hypothetical protein